MKYENGGICSQNYFDSDIQTRNAEKLGALLSEVVETAQEIPLKTIECAREMLEEEIEERKEKLILRKQLVDTIYENKAKVMREEVSRLADENL